MEIALEAGADDVKQVGDKFEVTCDANLFAKVADALKAAGIEPEIEPAHAHPRQHRQRRRSRHRPQSAQPDGALDNHDDVQSVSANFNIPDEAMAQIAG